jgi:hypothetical protein
MYIMSLKPLRRLSFRSVKPTLEETHVNSRNIAINRACLNYQQGLRNPDKVNLIFTASSAYTSILASLSASTSMERECFGDSTNLRSKEEPTVRTPAEYAVSKLVFSIAILQIELALVLDGRSSELRSRSLQIPFCFELNSTPSNQSADFRSYQPSVLKPAIADIEQTGRTRDGQKKP